MPSRTSSPLLGEFPLKSGQRSPSSDYGSDGGDSRSSGARRWRKRYNSASPVVILLLLVLVCRRPSAEELARRAVSINDALRCAPKNELVSVAAVCAGSNSSSDASPLDIGMDRHLAGAQCDAAFPGLYAEADRARDWYRARGGVTLQELDEAEEVGQARVIIKRGRMYVASYHEDRQQGTRTKAVLASINEAIITATEPIPDVEFVSLRHPRSALFMTTD